MKKSLVLLLLAVFPAAAEEAENLTANLKVKVESL